MFRPGCQYCVNSPWSNGAIGDTSQVGFGSKLAGGVRGYPCSERSFAAVCFRMEFTSMAVKSGLAEITSPATPATSGVALERATESFRGTAR